MSKIFGEFKNLEDLNDTAINLREAGENEELFILGQENEISEETINKFINEEIEYLVNPSEVSEEKKCRVCGCTENNACEDGCYWVEDNLCSKCEENVQQNEEIVQQSEGIVHENETSVEKLKRELEKSKVNSVPAAPIVKYLLGKCDSEDSFASRVLLKDKNLKECFDYVYSEVKKKLKSVSGWISDEEVYKIAEDYFILDTIKIEDKVPERISKSSGNAENKEKVLIKKENNTEEIKIDTRKEVTVKIKKEKQSQVLMTGQVSLFDF